MTNIDFICPDCRAIVCNVCELTEPWMLVMYARDYLEHVDKCKKKPL